MPTEREKMLAGDPYLANDPELHAERVRARRLWLRYNALDPEATAERRDLLEQLIGRAGPNVDIQAPFYCDYGTNIDIGADVFMNFDCTLLDCALITIGAQTQIGPAVQLYTATHPLDAAERVSGVESAKPITIGRRVWLGGGTIVLPGVTIGDDTVVGAGSVVTRDLPAGVIAAGSPCRVLRPVSAPRTSRPSP